MSAPIPTGRTELSILPDASKATNLPVSPAPALITLPFVIVKSNTPVAFKAGSLLASPAPAEVVKVFYYFCC